MLNVHYTPGDGKGWALDEDLRLIRSSLKGIVRETGAASADVIHAPFWQNLSMVAPPLLDRAFVIAHADNPPFFYLKQPEFAAGQTQVDLWVARSREAFDQFTRLGLPAEHIPYAIDPELFFPIPDKAALRREFGIPEEAYVIANFHRDSEGANLAIPKAQKAPEFMVAILKRLRDAGAAFHVLLAGPRRHWLRSELRREGIPFTFVGKCDVGGDDFGINILGRVQLNKLYNASDLYLIPSRWEGGPQSAMEAAACRCKILSTPLGVARDILEPVSLFRTASEAAARLLEDIGSRTLDATVAPQFDRWKSSHTTGEMSLRLRGLYASLVERSAFKQKAKRKKLLSLRGGWLQLRHTFRRRFIKPSLPEEVAWNHAEGRLQDLDEILAVVRKSLEQLGIRAVSRGEAEVEIVGWPESRAGGRRQLQWIVPGFPSSQIMPSALLIAPSVQDVLNLRAAGRTQPAVAMAVPLGGSGDSGDVLIVEPGDVGASVRIWRAMSAGRPVVYPEGTAYYEQVFHAGLCSSEPTEMARLATDNAAELRSLAVLPTQDDALKFLQVLLRELRSKESHPVHYPMISTNDHPQQSLPFR